MLQGIQCLRVTDDQNVQEDKYFKDFQGLFLAFEKLVVEQGLKYFKPTATFVCFYFCFFHIDRLTLLTRTALCAYKPSQGACFVRKKSTFWCKGSISLVYVFFLAFFFFF